MHTKWCGDETEGSWDRLPTAAGTVSPRLLGLSSPHAGCQPQEQDLCHTHLCLVKVFRMNEMSERVQVCHLSAALIFVTPQEMRGGLLSSGC